MKNGFTLVELVITIGLMAILGLVIVSNMTGTLDSQQQEQYDLFKETLENAACVYIDLNVAKTIKTTCKSTGSCTVAISVLLQEGLIEESDLENPKTQTKIATSKTLKITYSGGVKTCTYTE